MWDGCGAVLRPRGVRWRSAEANAKKVYENRHSREESFGHHHRHHHHHYRAALINTNAFHTIENPRTRKKSREGNASENVGTLTLPRDPLLSRGLSKTSPGGLLSISPRSPSLALGTVVSPITSCAAMWGGRGAVLRPRGVRWRSVAAGVKKVY